MQQVLQATKDRDLEVAAWLEVIDRFDAAVATGATVADLAALAGDVSGRPVGIRDEWSGVRLAVTDGVVVEGDEQFGAAVVSKAVATRLRGRNACKIAVPGGSALAASIESGAGRLGLAWLCGSRRYAWRPVHHLVVERLATSVAAVALRRGSKVPGTSALDPAAVERLLAGGLSDHDLARASRSARLPPEGRYVAIALEQSPPNAVSLEVLGAIVERSIAGHRGVARTAVIGRTAAVVAIAGDHLEAALGRVVEDRAGGFVVRAGVGDAVSLAELGNSWTHARETLALHGIARRRSDVAFFDDLGIQHLLAQIPVEEIVASDLFQRLADTMSRRSSPTDVEVLEAYLEEGTLRRAAARVFLHHTTVEHRLRRIEVQLGLDLSQPAARFEVGLLLKLHRIVRAHDAARQ